jgi:hypothetical protein
MEVFLAECFNRTTVETFTDELLSNSGVQIFENGLNVDGQQWIDEHLTQHGQ